MKVTVHFHCHKKLPVLHHNFLNTFSNPHITLFDPDLLGSYPPWFLPCCLIQPTSITSVMEQGNNGVCFYTTMEKLFLEQTTLCAWHVDTSVPSHIPLSQHSKRSTSPTNSCQGREIHQPVRTGAETGREPGTKNGNALRPKQLLCRGKRQKTEIERNRDREGEGEKET